MLLQSQFHRELLFPPLRRGLFEFLSSDLSLTSFLQDLYNRSGTYRHPVPCIIGNEPAGVIVAVGTNVHHLQVGDRAIGFCNMSAYTEYWVGKGDKTVKLPVGITTKMAATAFLQGVTGELSVHGGQITEISDFKLEAL